MITVVEPQQHIAKLWSEPTLKEGTLYRLMHYVLRVEDGCTVLLHNVVTGHLIALEQQEAEMLGRLHAMYCPAMEPLIQSHFVVPADYDEHAQTIKMQTVLRMLTKAQQKPDITHYTILPTTACNARCYYCFQQGLKQTTMSDEIIHQVTDFIDAHCGNDRKIRISWFGGEPTVAARQISTICEELQKKNILYRSSMTTNGYLFDQKMTETAVDLWKLKYVMISVDGTEKNYNSIKRFQNAKDNPYQRVMGNVERLLKHGIRVSMRMNFDLNNYLDFFGLLDDVSERFQGSPLFFFHVHQVNGEHGDSFGKKEHGKNEWFQDKLLEYQELVHEKGLYPLNEELPELYFKGCQASNDHSVTINPQGGISRCPELVSDEDLIGTVREGITNPALVSAWSKPSDFESCVECPLFPNCMKLHLCPASHRCVAKKESLTRFQNAMKKQYRSFSRSIQKGG